MSFATWPMLLRSGSLTRRMGLIPMRTACKRMANLGMEPLESRRLLAVAAPGLSGIDPRPGAAEVASMAPISASASAAWQTSEVAAHPSQDPPRTLAEEVEPNGSLASAVTLPGAAMVEVAGQLGPGDGMDMFRVPTAANARGLRLDMAMDSPPTGKPMQVSVFDGSGRPIGNRSVDPVSGRLSLDLTWTGATPPTDLFVVLGLDGQGAQASVGAYRLSMEPFDPFGARPDTSDRPSFLSPVGFGEIITPPLSIPVSPGSGGGIWAGGRTLQAGLAGGFNDDSFSDLFVAKNGDGVVSLLLGSRNGLSLTSVVRHSGLAHTTAISRSALEITVADESEEAASLFTLAFDFGIAVLPTNTNTWPQWSTQPDFFPLPGSNLAFVVVLSSVRLGHAGATRATGATGATDVAPGGNAVLINFLSGLDPSFNRDSPAEGVPATDAIGADGSRETDGDGHPAPLKESAELPSSSDRPDASSEVDAGGDFSAGFFFAVAAYRVVWSDQRVSNRVGRHRDSRASRRRSRREDSSS
jgi:hypothetical protein